MTNKLEEIEDLIDNYVDEKGQFWYEWPLYQLAVIFLKWHKNEIKLLMANRKKKLG